MRPPLHARCSASLKQPCCNRYVDATKEVAVAIVRHSVKIGIRFTVQANPDGHKGVVEAPTRVTTSGTRSAPVGVKYNLIRDVDDLSPADREAIEALLGHPLGKGGQVFLLRDDLNREQRTRWNALIASVAPFHRNVTASGASRDCSNIPGGIIHDWTGITFVPGVTLQQTLTALQDYDRDTDYYRPTVLRAKLLSRAGNSFRVLLRLKERHVLTVVLDTEYEIQYLVVNSTHAASISHSTRITEIESPGSPHERATSPKDDHGFLWRLNSYWRFYQADGGVYIQCNAISLTRDVPTGLGWLVGPFIANVPRESLDFTLTATREALLKKFPSEAGK